MKKYSNCPKMLRFGSLAIICCLCFRYTMAQKLESPDYDSSYYESYPESVITRFYMSRKYTNLELQKGNDAPRLRYLSNSSVNTGLGASYHGLSLNIAYGFWAKNHDTEKGNTKKLDLQARLYSRKWAVDLYGQFYKGYYLYPKGRGHEDINSYYIRPDLKVGLAGLAVYKIFNYRKFTLHQAFVQDEWQKKSAGSFLAGMEAYYTDFHGDSALVPSQLNLFYDRREIRRVRFIKIGPGAGYAYTQVLPLHLYITASLTANVNLALVQETGVSSGMVSHLSVNANLIYRLAAGYSNGIWNVTAFWLNNRNSTKGALSGNDYIFNTGNYRLILAKRIQPGDKTKRFLKKWVRR